MDLTFQVPMQYYSLQHQILLLSPVTSTIAYCFCFGSIPSFFLELLLHWSPVAYWALTNPGSSLSVSHHFAFHTVHGVLKARILMWFAIPFSSGLHFVRSLPPWPVHLGTSCTAWQFHWVTKGCDSLVSFLWLWLLFWRPWDWNSCFFSLPSDGWG